ncbi:MAG: GNAT family N-acetyltransferase [Dehalococcoidia bacterium]
MDGRFVRADTADIERIWRERWGLPLISVRRQYEPADVEGMFYEDEWGTPQGLVTWHVDGDDAEIVSLDAFEQGRHIGGRLIDAAENELLALGVKRVTIVTTNDNIRALSFYVRHGYRLVALHLDAVEAVRKVKPSVPLTGNHNLPLQDMLELVKQF